MYRVRDLVIALSCCAAFSCGVGGARASQLEEVIVTAGFRPTALTSTPGSVSVIDAVTLGQRGARHLEDALLTAPNVNFSGGGSRARFLQIRGVGDLEQFVDPKHFPAVGIILDGIELSNLATSALLFDTEQVEILRGPQGTRFGSSALVGLINIRSHDPSPEFEADLRAGYGNNNRWHLGAAVGGPLSNTLQGRVAIQQNSSDGHIKNLLHRTDDTHDQDELGVRAKLRWLITPSLRNDFSALYMDIENGYDAFSLDNIRATHSDQPGTDAQESIALGNTTTWDARLGKFTLQLSHTDAEEHYAYDEDWVFIGYCDGVRCDPALEFSSADSLLRERQQTAIDLRWLGGNEHVNWVLGAYYQTRDEDLQRQRFGRFVSAYETERVAAYGQLRFSVNPMLTMRLGIRGESFDDEYQDTNSFTDGSHDLLWSGEATLEFRPSLSTLVYGTLSRGAKPGGLNTEASSVAPFMARQFQRFVNSRLRFKSETLFNKEIGIKGSYFENRIHIQAALFHMDRDNAQLESWLWDAANFIWVGVLDNVSDAENYGLEVELNWAATSIFDLFGNVGYLKTNIDQMRVFDLDRNAFRELRDRDQTKAPRWQFRFGVRAKITPVVVGSISVEGRDQSYFGYYHDQKLDSYTILNASLSYQYSPLELRVWARNLLASKYAVHGLYFANDPRDAYAINHAYKQFGEPRVLGLDIIWRF